MEEKVKELTAKLRALDFAVKRSDEVVKTNSSEAISRHEQSIVTKINACHTLKDSSRKKNCKRGIRRASDRVGEWTADKKVLELRGITDGIVRKTQAFQKAEGVKEELMLQEEKHEQNYVKSTSYSSNS